MDDRLTNLEEQFAFLERHVAQLDEVVREVYDRVDGLTREISQMREEIQERGNTEEEARTLEDEKPPHW